LPVEEIDTMTRRRIVLLSLLAIVLGLGAAAFLVPLSAFRAPLEVAASRALDRQVQIAGSLHLELYPQLGISLKDVSIANTAGASEPQMITVGKIVVGAELGPLLSGHLHVTKVVLKHPLIHLDVGSDGVGNWQSATAGATQDPAASADLAIERIKIEDAEITYADARTGKSEALSAVSLSLTMPKAETGTTRPLILDGTATYNAVPLKLDARLDDVQGFLKGQPSNATFGLGSDLFTVALAGRVDAPGTMQGTLKLTAKSLRQLAAWSGQSLPPGNGLGAITVDATVLASPGTYALSNAKIALDGMSLSGDVSVDTKLAISALKGNLAIDHVNVAPYLAPGATADLNSAAQQTTRDTPLALGGLKGVDGDLSLTIGGLTLPPFKLDRAVLAAVLHGGVLKTDLSSIAAYGGTGRGSLTVDVTVPVPSIHSVLDMSGIRAEQFLDALMGIPRVRAGGSVHLDVASRGQTETDIVKALSGKGSVNFGAGSISGVDLGAVAKLVQTTAGVLSGALGDAAKTEFSSLGASFTIQNGVIHTADLRMVGPTIETTGAGTINLLTHQVDFHLNPKAKLGVAGITLADIGVPFHVTGTWDNPNFTPDLSSLPAGIAGSVAGTATQVLSVPGTALKSLFGGH
jgi:AsmA protein